MRNAIAAAALLALAGCASIETPLDDGYQVGDLTGTTLELQSRYCDTADPYKRAITLAVMHRVGVPLPPNGVCVDLLEALDADLYSRASAD